ncbi:hypothetical protein EL753P1_00056 [Eggerthella phage EL753P1]|nr:hypothetical protein EL753P1_00056 [Eggerthella phage EL753P1]
MKVKDALNELRAANPRSAWDRGVNEYAIELLDWGIDPERELGGMDARGLRRLLLNGAGSWQEYSYSGCALVFDEDICRRLCSPSKQEATRHGEWNPSWDETWLDMQARALDEAFWKIRRMARR